MTEPYPFPTSADEFADKRMLVTGGTRGIGAAVVRRFQLAGARVVATARSAPAQASDRVLLIPADIGTAADVETVVSRLMADWGGPHPGQQRPRRGNQARWVRIPVRRRLAGDH
jgi:NAD(P)-dependent dehydrogenase (short-subunit alcohol dehydrogenase family)